MQKGSDSIFTRIEWGWGTQLLFKRPESTDHTAQEQSATDEGRGQRKTKNEGVRFFLGWRHFTFFPRQIEEYGKKYLDKL